MKKNGLLIIIACFLLNGCRKYSEDTSLMHLRTPKERLIHTYRWGTPSTYNYITKKNGMGGSSEDYIDFKTDGRLEGSMSYSLDYSTFYHLYFDGGKWEFTKHKKGLLITDKNGYQTEYTIMQLDPHILSFQNDSIKFTFKEIHGS